MSQPVAGFAGILETVLYYEPSAKADMERFYSDVLALRAVSSWDDGTAYRVGSGMLLLFDVEKLGRRSEPYSRHGATGAGHTCLVASPGEYEGWKQRLAGQRVSIDHEAHWPGGASSFYFRDPAGNLLEIADGDLWPE
jgi:catechol 2,3-dioxygenase-like lactoylglutathione lyase family enzyme